jgi:hypothetical protein
MAEFGAIEDVATAKAMEFFKMVSEVTKTKESQNDGEEFLQNLSRFERACLASLENPSKEPMGKTLSVEAMLGLQLHSRVLQIKYM